MLIEKEVVAPAPSIATDPIFVAIEMSRSKWVVGSYVPTSSKVGIHTVEWGDTAALLSLVERLRSRAADLVGAATVPVLCCYEAGYEGFWLYRRLIAAGLRVLVIDPSSLLVNRRAKRAKTDRIDAKSMIRALMAYNRGEDQMGPVAACVGIDWRVFGRHEAIRSRGEFNGVIVWLLGEGLPSVDLAHGDLS